MFSHTTQHFFHSDSGTISYVVYDEESQQGVIIDPFADYDVESNQISFESTQLLLSYIKENDIHIVAILETHIHADHLTGAFYLSEQLSAPVYTSEGIKQVYSTWKDRLSLNKMYHFKRHLSEGENFDIGRYLLEVINTEGHTPSDLTFKVGDTIFVGDSLFYKGTGRADFPGGSAEQMFESISKLYDMEDSTKVYLCHNYPDKEDELIYQTTIGTEKAHNAFMKGSTTKRQFVERREQRDEQLAEPKLMRPALTYNLTAELPRSIS